MTKEKEIRIPDAVEWSGEEEERIGFKLYIRKIILDEIETYLESDIKNELGGVLIGECGTVSGENVIIIEDIIIALYTETSLSRLTFTHETWEYINNILEKNHPGKKIVGWFHSHPGHGVFMSGYDKFIQENFFNGECMTALVYDPVRRERGFFRFDGNNIIELKSYGIYNESNYLFPQPVKLTGSTKKNTVRKKIKIKDVLLFILVPASIILIILIIGTQSRYNTLHTELNNQKVKTEKLETEINELSELLNSLGNLGENDKANIIKYEIRPGDDLRKLAIRFYDNPEMYDTLVKHNKLQNEFDIYPGKKIEIPF
ncbi:MAG: Mov34/MPN/PAD-1 family protein [Ignavibacteria bacterium]|nr:Mov34/MPN/PAD-1 family protein [Ignavibacteria bacterium]